MHNDLHYLQAAERMQWHLLDFSVGEGEFARSFVFEMCRPTLLAAVSTYTSFKEWKNLNEVLVMDQRAILGELDACLSQAKELDYDMDVYMIAAYIEVNEYANYCFERLKNYVDAFYVPFQIDEDEDFYDDDIEI